MNRTPGNTCSPLARRTFRRILLIKPSSLGDVVHALPVLAGLRRRYPEASIDWLVSASCAGLLADHPQLDELLIFDRRRFGRMGRDWSAQVGFWRFVRTLRARGYDLAIDLQGLFRSGFLAAASAAPVRLGFADARELAWVFYTHRLPAPVGALHAVDKNRLMTDCLDIETGPALFDLAVRTAERDAAARLLQREGLEPTEPFVAVLPGARWETKRWLPERFAEVIDRIHAGHGLRSVLMGGPEERALCGSIRRRCVSAPADLGGRTDLRELTAVLEMASVVVCHDSAPMHLAAALGRPMVCLLGPTDRRRTGPYGGFAAILQSELPCVPCGLRRLGQCRHAHQCMRDLSTEDVVRAVTEALPAKVRQVGHQPV